MKLSVCISQLLKLRAENSAEPDLAVVAVFLEKAGIATIELDAVAEPSVELWRELQRMRETTRLPLGIRTAPEPEIVQKYLELHPERITFCDNSGKGASQPMSLTEEQPELTEAVKLIREHGTECIIKIAPQLNDIKKAVKLRCFGIELDTRDWQSLHGTELRSLQDSWRDAALGAWKLGLTVECETNIYSETLAVIRAIPEVGRLILGEDFWSKAVLYGIDQTVIGIRNAM